VVVVDHAGSKYKLRNIVQAHFDEARIEGYNSLADVQIIQSNQSLVFHTLPKGPGFFHLGNQEHSSWCFTELSPVSSHIVIVEMCHSGFSVYFMVHSIFTVDYSLVVVDFDLS